MKYKTRETITDKKALYTLGIDTTLLRKKNVTGYYTGTKIVNGVDTKVKCITFGVSKKESLDNLSEFDKIPDQLNGLPTDVIISEIPVADDLASGFNCGADCGPYCKPRSKYPYGCTDQSLAGDGDWYSCIPGGVSMGIPGSGTGTLGFNGSNIHGESVAVTNNHVLGKHFYHPSTEPTIVFEVYLTDSGVWHFKLQNPLRDVSHGISHELKKEWIKSGKMNLHNHVFKNPRFDGFDSPMLEGDRHYKFINTTQNHGVKIGFSFRYDYIDLNALEQAFSDYFSMQGPFPDPLNFKHVTGNLLIYEQKGHFKSKIHDQFGYTEYGKSTRVAAVAYPGETYDIVFDHSNFSHSRVHYYSYESKGSGAFTELLFFGRGCVSGKDALGEDLRLNEEGFRRAYYPSFKDAKNPAGPISQLAHTPTSTAHHTSYHGSKPIGMSYLYPMYQESYINTLKWNHGLQPSNVIDAAYVRYDNAVPLASMVGIPSYNPYAFTRGRLGMRLMKSGRTTGVTTNGIVTADDYTGYIDYCGGNRVIVTDVLKYETASDTYFSDSGDSGSAILSAVTGCVVGLNFAGSGGNIPYYGGHWYRGFGCKIENMVDLMEISPINDFLVYKSDSVVNDAGNLKSTDEIGHCGISYKKVTNTGDGAGENGGSISIIPPKRVVRFQPISTPTPTGTFTITPTGTFTTTPTETPPTGTFTTTPTETPPTGTFTTTPTVTSTSLRNFEGAYTPTVTETPPTGTFTPTPTETPPTGTSTTTPTETPTPLDSIN